jgi:hypothetical protein
VYAANEVIECNRYSERFGLTLTHAQAVELMETRSLALGESGRVELGAGIIHKLIMAFCDSPFLSNDNYAQILNELVEIFYYYKNDTMDMVPDDELLQYMKESFNGVCGGSVDLLAERELYRYAVSLRRGYFCEYEDDEEDNDDENCIE